MVEWNDYTPCLNSQGESKTSCPGERPSWPVQCEIQRSLTPLSGERSPPAAMEPPAFHPPSGMESASGGEAQQNVLLEVLSYCGFLAAAVQRLEQKIDSLQSSVAVGGGHLSRSLAQRLGPSPQPKLQRNPVQERDAAPVVPHTVGGKKNKKRRRHRAQRASEPKQEAPRDANEDELRDCDLQKNNTAKRHWKQRKRPAAARCDPAEVNHSEE